MTSAYPGAFDALTNPGANLSSSPTHSSQHINLNDAVEAIQAELGLTPSGAAATVAARLTAVDASIAQHSGRWRRVSTQSIPSGTETAISWDTEDLDDDNILPHHVTTGTTGTIAAAGTYAICAKGTWLSNPGTSAYVLINSTPTIVWADGGNVTGVWSVSHPCLPLAVGNTVQVKVAQTSGGALSIASASLWLYRIGP